MCRSKHVEPSINFGIINSITKLQITQILDKLLEYKRNWIQHVNRVPRNGLPRVMKRYSPTPPPSRWRYSPGWALASSTMCLQASRFLALSFHSFKPIFLTSVDTSSSHLIFGLPLRLVAYSFPYNIFLLELRCLAFFLCDQATVFFGIQPLGD